MNAITRVKSAQQAVALPPTIIGPYTDLPTPVQKAITNLFIDFRASPLSPGDHLERLEGFALAIDGFPSFVVTWALKHMRLHNPNNPWTPTAQHVHELCEQAATQWLNAIYRYVREGRWLAPDKFGGEGSPAPFSPGCFVDSQACIRMLRKYPSIWQDDVVNVSDDHFERIPHAAYDEGERERVLGARAARQSALAGVH